YIDESVKGASSSAKPTDKSAPSKTAASPSSNAPKAATAAKASEPRVMPSAARALAQSGLSTADVEPTGPGGRVLKEDVQRRIDRGAKTQRADETITEAPTTPSIGRPVVSAADERPKSAAGNREEEVVPMTPMRRRIAARLVEAQNTAALLTTFNEIDMSA